MATLPRVFARLRALDIQCPACGALSILTHYPLYKGLRVTQRRIRPQKPAPWKPRPSPHQTTREWDPTTGRWHCRKCARTFSLGVVIWKHPTGHPHPPGDRVPTAEESQALRGVMVDARVGTGTRARGNLLVEGGVSVDPANLPARVTVEGDAFVDYLDDAESAPEGEGEA